MRHIDEHHHNKFTARRPNGVFAAVVPVVDRCLIAVVAVRDIQLARGKIAAECLDGKRVVDNPQAVRHEAVGKFTPRCAARKAVDTALGLAGVVHIKGINLAEIAVGRLHQVEAVLLGFGERLLMRQHDARAEILHADKTDDALERAFLAVVDAGEKFFLVDVDARVVVAVQRAVRKPAAQRFPGVAVGILALRQLEPDDVVRVAREVFGALRVADDVVGRAGQLCGRAGRGSIAHGVKSLDVGHSGFIPSIFF